MATRTAQERAAEIARIKAENEARKARIAKPSAVAAPAPAPAPATTYFDNVGLQVAMARRDEDSRRAAYPVATLQDTVPKGREGEDSRRALSPVAISQGSVFRGREGEDSRRAAAPVRIDENFTPRGIAGEDSQRAGAVGIISAVSATVSPSTPGVTTTAVSAPISLATPPGGPTPVEPEAAGFAIVRSRLSEYGLEGLESALKKIRNDYPELPSDDIMFLLENDERYNAPFKKRFKANDARAAKGLPRLSAAEYLNMEKGYKKLFTTYNLPMFANQGQYEKMIESDIDIDDATDRVVKAYDRVISDVPTRNAFRQFYGTVTDSDIVSALLDPTQQIPALEKKVMAAEIGGQALRQGLTASLTAGEPVKTAYTNVQRGTLGAQELAAQGVTEEQAARDYEIIAEQLPTAEKLSSIYANRAEQVSQRELEQAEILGLESAKRKQRRLAGMERATFGGESGVSQTSLGRRGTAGAF